MEKQHLHLLINEEIYRIDGDHKLNIAVKESITEEVQVATEKNESIVSEPKPIAKQKEELAEKPKASETKQESPEIPVRKREEPKEIPLAIFHNSTNQEEMELLQKIIDACKVPKEDYIIFENGFDQSVAFKKALVFVPEARAFYSPIPYKNSHFLCSKPLADLTNDQQEKGKLWVALQKFVLN